MMDFEEFTQQVAEEIKRFLPTQYEDASVNK